MLFHNRDIKELFIVAFVRILDMSHTYMEISSVNLLIFRPGIKPSTYVVVHVHAQANVQVLRL